MTDETELTDEQLALGGFRFEDLQELRIVENRTDLARKQDEHKFPLPIKTGKSQTLFLKAEVFAWLRERAAKREAPAPVEPPAAVPAPLQTTKQLKAPPRRPVGRPRKTPAIGRGQSCYQYAVKAGAPRIDLDGNAAGHVSEEEAEHARRSVAGLKAMRSPKKAVAVVVAAPPVPPKPPPKDGLSALREAEQRRKASMAGDQTPVHAADQSARSAGSSDQQPQSRKAVN